LKIETQALENRQTKIIAELDPEVFGQYMRRAARKISEKARIPGFRPGKAPYEVVRRIYGDEALQQEAVEIMLDEVYPQILREAQVEASGPGKLEEIISMDPPRFAFVVPLKPEIQLGDYLSIRKEYAPEPVTDEQVEKALLRLRRSYGTAEPVERPAQTGDLVAFKLSARRLNPEEDQSATLLDSPNQQMVAGEPEDEENGNWPYRGFSQELVGLSAGETKTWTHTFDEETVFEDLRGKEAEFTVEVQSVKELHLPELDDEFAQMVGQFENMDALRKAIRAQLEENYQQQYDSKFYNDVIDQIVAQATVQYPPHMLEEEIEDFLHNVEHDLENQRLDLETYLKLRDLDRETFIETEVKPAAARRLERSLVLSEVARQENVQVKEEEIRSIYFTALQQMQSPEMRKYQTRVKRTAQDMANSIASSTINNIFNQRLMARLKAIATGKADEEETPAVVDETVSLSGEASAEAPVEPASEAAPAPAETSGESEPAPAETDAARQDPE